ncbi:immunoglobulin superfamily DCC subclass member 3-like [Littorina saxatilis]|uniref:immunoglobulin superfamily DCC subclass member 3-like n=1 Tax=Littorina saxatilis TaxID=31220 RepID=UPI0038B49A6A
MRRSSLSLNCPVSAEPQFGHLTYTWRKDDEEIRSRSPRGRRYVFQNGTLHIRKVVHRSRGATRVSDDGIYECYVANSLGTVLAQRIQLVIASVGKTFTKEPSNGSVAVGETFYLPCQIHASPPDLMVVWQRGGALLKVENNPRYVVTKDGLLIVDAQVEDRGTYQCQVTNKNFFPFVNDNSPSPPQWRISRPATLYVTESAAVGDANFLLTPDNMTDVLLGDAVDIHCVPSVYTPGVITWTHIAASKAARPVAVQNSKHISLLPGGILRIHRATRDHAGQYICTHNLVSLSVSGYLQVLEEPVIENSSPSRSYPLASIIKFSCHVAGQPPPTLRWLKNGQEITPVRHRVEFLRDMMFIYQSNQADSGYYQCLAENQVGWALSLARVVIKLELDSPSPPHNLTGEAISSSRIKVLWQYEPSPDLIGFTVHKGLDHEEVVEIVAKERRQAVLYDLAPDTQYSISVRAYKKQGASPSSQPVLIRTDLTGYPSVTLTYISNSSISLNWSDFHTRHRRKDDIAAYEAYYGLSNSDHVDEVVLDSSQDSLLVTELEENREYRVRMKALFKGNNPHVHDEAWPWSYIRTGNVTLADTDTHLAAPEKIHAFVLKSDAISVSWFYGGGKQNAALPVTHYTVRCETMLLGRSCQKVTAKHVILKISHTNFATVDKLQAFTIYNISVSANSDSIQGPYSRPILAQTKEDVPSKPEHLQAKVISQGQVHLQWQPPLWPNGLIQGHFIQYVSRQFNAREEISTNDNLLKNASWVQVYQRGNMTQATVGNLTQRLYIFQVMACTNAGKGDPSTLVFVHMGDQGSGSSKSGLSDQHLGILGGSVIGLTSIIVTVIVIVCKQRQLQKQLESRMMLDQGRQTASSASDLQTPASLTSQLSPSTVKSEELEQLLSSGTPSAPPFQTVITPTATATTIIDNDSMDSGCSSMPPPTEGNSVAVDEDVIDENHCLIERRVDKGDILQGENATSVAMVTANGAGLCAEDRETTC